MGSLGVRASNAQVSLVMEVGPLKLLYALSLFDLLAEWWAHNFVQLMSYQISSLFQGMCREIES